MELFSPEFFSALLAIIVIDLVLAGDNAIVIALAARNLPPSLRTKAIAWGTIGAIAVRTAMTLVVVWLLKVPGLLFVGGALLVWIAYKLLTDDGGDSHNVEAAQSFAGAMKTIVVADALMGLDNVLAVAGAAHGSFLLVVLGLLISIPIVIWGSQLILKFVERYPVIVYVGSGVLAWTAVKMMGSEPLVRDFITQYPVIKPIAYIAIIGGVLGFGFLRQHAPVRARVAAHVVDEHGVVTPLEPVAEPRKVLVGVDGSPNSLKAVRSALTRHGAAGSLELHVVHVPARWGVSRATAERTLADIRALLDEARVPYAVHTEQGDFAQAVNRAAQRLHAQHIVMGAAPSRSITRMMQDAVTLRLLDSTQVPVEVVPGQSVSPLERLGVALSACAIAASVVLAAAD